MFCTEGKVLQAPSGLWRMEGLALQAPGGLRFVKSLKDSGASLPLRPILHRQQRRRLHGAVVRFGCAVARDAITASSLEGAVITCETLSSSGHDNDFFDGCHDNECSMSASQVDW